MLAQTPARFACAHCGSKYTLFRLYCKQCGCVMPEALPSEVKTARLLRNNPALPVDVVWGRTYFHRHAKLFLRREGMDLGIQVPLTTPTVLIGRETVNFKPTLAFSAVEADSLGLSRAHARLDYVDNKALVTDLNSTNGTFLDGTALIPHIAQALHNQAALQLGQLLLRVEFK